MCPSSPRGPASLRHPGDRKPPRAEPPRPVTRPFVKGVPAPPVALPDYPRLRRKQLLKFFGIRPYECAARLHRSLTTQSLGDISEEGAEIGPTGCGLTR